MTMSKSNQNGVKLDPEVLVRLSRLTIGDPDKLRILAEVDQARATGGKVKEILRREGIYSSQLTEWWRKFSGNGKGAKRPVSAVVVRRLSGENARLREELRQAKLVIGIPKKVAALMGRPLGEDGRPIPS